MSTFSMPLVTLQTFPLTSSTTTADTAALNFPFAVAKRSQPDQSSVALTIKQEERDEPGTYVPRRSEL